MSSDLVLDADALEAIGLNLGEPVRDAKPMAWGWATPTTCLHLASGRRVVVQRRSRPAADRIAMATRVFDGAGIPVPRIRGEVRERAGVLLIFEFVPGEIAASQLEGPGGAEVARLMGVALERLRSIDARLVPLDGPWESPSALLDVAASWQLAVPTGSMRKDAAASVRRVARAGWTATISHGDFVPANAMVESGHLAALLDLDGVAVRHRLLDMAWWSLMVRHHHPASHRLIDTFIAAATAGERKPAEGRLADVAVARALQLMDMAAPDQRGHLRALLATSLDWANPQTGRARLPSARPSA
jgi:aminoglycoside phosphotransferase